ncbi:MAG: ABC transporter ATP-binding protein [Lachnospiraceae bacterium]|nr:ABC transporter ATP-binding protein [Lachnospiraceae bacterium]
MVLLDVKKLNVYYGMIHAVKDVSFSVNEGDIVTLIGANGAGKTTILQTLTGIVPIKSGKVKYHGKDISKKLNHKLVNDGIAHVPEGRRIFASLSVYQNLKLGAFTRNNREEIEESLENVYKKFPILKERSKQLAGTLSGGEQQMLAVGRALMSKPKLLFLDEPSMGLSPIYVNTIFDIIEEVHKEGVSILLVEQNAKKALSIATKAYVLETGKIVKEGNPKELLDDPAIKASYLGE